MDSCFLYNFSKGRKQRNKFILTFSGVVSDDRPGGIRDPFSQWLWRQMMTTQPEACEHVTQLQQFPMGNDYPTCKDFIRRTAQKKSTDSTGKKAVLVTYCEMLKGLSEALAVETLKKRPKGKPKTTVLNVDAWNVRTFLNTIAKRQDRRTALLARELQHYNVDIAALTETCFADKRSLTESCGYTFFWSTQSTESYINSFSYS